MAAKVLSNRYKLIKALGAGGFGRTFIARDMQRPGAPPCVVKQLKPASNDPNFIREARRLFETEAATLERLGKHDQIPQLLAYFEEGQQFFLVQEFIDGQALGDELKAEVVDAAIEEGSGSLTDLEGFVAQADQRDKTLKKGKCLSEGEVIAILRDVLAILEFVHAEGVIHRDIKPDNLIRRKADGKIVLIDFGAVRAMQEGTQIQTTESGESRFTVTIGTPGYMPSEQCAGRPNYSSDIYALGMVAIKALTGYAPTDLPTDPATGELVWRDKARVSNGLAMVLTRMVRYHYTQRYQSIREVKQGITTFATMTEVERQATTSKLVKSTILTESSRLTTSQSNAKSTDRSPSRRSVAVSSSSSSNSGVLFLFGGLLAVVAVIAAFALPAMMRSNQSSVIVNNQPSPTKPIATDATSTPPPKTASSESINQAINLEVNKELTIPQNIFGNAVHIYRIQAKTGQVLNSTVAGNGVLITVFNTQGIILPDASNVLSANVPIATDGEYTVQVKGLGGNAEVPYQLTLGLKDTASSTAPTPLTTPTSVLPTPTSGTPTPPNPQSTGTPTNPSPTPTPPPPQIEIKVRNR